MKRVIWIVLDSVGMGAMPDAHLYGDEGSNTIGNISEKLGGLHMPNMQNLGLGNIEGMVGIDPVTTPKGSYARLAELSKGKDTTTGHWEMVGIHTKDGFPTYPDGFPRDIIEQFESKIGRKSLANYSASGTEIIEELGQKHVETGRPIVYTSADSVFQIAAHEDVISLEELYEMCTIARELLQGKHAVARVIARPFKGDVGNFVRTPNRRDYALVPPHKTTLDYLKEAGMDVIAIGKIEDIFAAQGITKAIHTTSNMDGVDATIGQIKSDSKGLIFTNLVDFDMKWGHRNDYVNYAKDLEAFDLRLPEILSAMKQDDLLFITADHGCDPTFPGTNHTREYVPFIAYGRMVKQNVNMKTRGSFADIGQTIGELFDLPKIPIGESFLPLIKMVSDTSFLGHTSSACKSPRKDVSDTIVSADYIKSQTDHRPSVAIILGSGLGDLANEIQHSVKIPYTQIPHFPVSTVVGHEGQLVIGELENTKVLAMQGRFHYYEGYPMEDVTYAIRVMKQMGIEKIIVTNAAGAVNTSFVPGDLMLITDHINLSGSNPLIGKNMDDFGVRFPDLSNAYNQSLRDLALRVANEERIDLKEGVYTFMSGPTYETPAEIRMIRSLGADAQKYQNRIFHNIRFPLLNYYHFMFFRFFT